VWPFSAAGGRAAFIETVIEWSRDIVKHKLVTRLTQALGLINSNTAKLPRLMCTGFTTTDKSIGSTINFAFVYYLSLLIVETGNMKN